MQNKVPLMCSLSKIISKNTPDLVLLVCEALVWNNVTYQIWMFYWSLRTGGHGCLIDGVVLIKFDTVSDNTGAALTMKRMEGSSVVFIGTGHKYKHLKRLGVQSFFKSLFP